MTFNDVYTLITNSNILVKDYNGNQYFAERGFNSKCGFIPFMNKKVISINDAMYLDYANDKYICYDCIEIIVED